MGTTYTIESETLTEIADAIRSKTGSSEEIPTVNMAGEIMGISGGGSDIWSGTHAEYEAEKTNIDNGTLICFNDDLGLEAESDYYSEVEQVIGTYLGKPLYRKVYFFNETIQGSVNKPHGLTNFTPVSIKGIGFSNDNVNLFPLPHTHPDYPGNAIGLFINNTNISFRLKTIVLTKAYVVVEYTKTTDSVVGVVGGIKKGDNYSTNEQVIGTWIDGKPLYRKVFTNLNTEIVMNTWTRFPNTEIPNIDKFIECKCITNNYLVYKPINSNYDINMVGVNPDSVGQVRVINTVIVEYTKTTD